MWESQMPTVNDPYRVISALPNGQYEAGQWYRECFDCGGRMAHGRMYLILGDALEMVKGKMRCEACHEAAFATWVDHGRRTHRYDRKHGYCISCGKRHGILALCQGSVSHGA